MARILFAVFGSLGDLHPHIALGLELKERGHQVSFATLEFYREKIEVLGFEFFPMRPNIMSDDAEMVRDLMDAKRGTERLFREVLFPALRESYADLMSAMAGVELLVSSEVALAAPLVAEKTNVRWVTTAVAPGGFLSAYDPFVPPTMPWFQHLRFLGPSFHKLLYVPINKMLWKWGEPVREFRKELGLRVDVEPIIRDKFSPFLNLALFSKVLGEPQPDWHQPTVQTGFAFYDGKRDSGKMPEDLEKFLQAGEPPIVFTLGSAAVWDARNFFHDSAEAAKKLRKRAVLILGENDLPQDLPPEIAVFNYAPYSEVFPKAACVVHQGGVGTTGQALRAGVPALVVPFSHDQPDNAARCVRIGCARTISRDNYNSNRAAKELQALLSNPNYKTRAEAAKAVVDSENGVKSACHEIERVLNSK
jgi:UDP:flavonoid glycosyltransferase YjiC (YdhE family)